jgi:membrane protein
MIFSYDKAMRLFRNPQLWLSLGKEIWDRNRGHNLKQIAASLAFTTTLSLVPMVTLATILVGYLPSVIQIKNAFRYWLLETYMPGGLNQQMIVYLDEFSSKARGLTYVGLIGLVITTIMTLTVIEGAFNQIFQIKEKRPLFKKIYIYSAVTIFGPILLGIGVYFSGILFSASEGWIKAVSVGFKVLATIAPILLAVIVYSVVYKILPYSKIRWVDAFTGGFFAALTFELMKFVFAVFLSNTAFYKTVYGAFAIFPLALIWIYLTWWITLAGAVLVSNLPNLRSGLIRVIRY